MYHNHFIRPNVPLQVLLIFPLQRWCKPNAMKLASIAEVQPILSKVSASGILQGHKSLLPRKIFQEIGVQSLLIQFLVPPKGEIFFGHPLHFHAFSLLLPHCT